MAKRRRSDPERERLRERAYQFWATHRFDVPATAAAVGVSPRTVIGWRTAHGLAEQSTDADPSPIDYQRTG